MKQIKNIIVKQISEYWLIWSMIVILSLFVVLLMTGDNIDKKSIDSTGWKWYSEFISAVLGAAIVTTVTFLLLNGQAKKENSVEQKKKVFENRLKAYESFLNLLSEVVVRNVVTNEDEKRLQFSVATIGMHASSKELYELSKNLKAIILKIKTEDTPNNSLWSEVTNIVRQFQASLYDGETFLNDSQLTKALCNFSGLCTQKHHEILEYIESMISDFGFDTFISDRCLFVSIPVKSHIIEEIQKSSGFAGEMPKKLYITLKIDGDVNLRYEGFFAIYYGRKEEEQKLIDTIYKDYWLDPNTEKRKKSDYKKDCVKDKDDKTIVGVPLSLSINMVYHSYFLYFKNRTDAELQSILVDTFRYIYKVWANEGTFVTVKVLEKNEATGKYELERRKSDFGSNLNNKEKDESAVDI